MAQLTSIFLYASRPEDFWIIEYDCQKNENTLTTSVRCVVYARSEYEARQLLTDYFNKNKYIKAKYKKIYSVQKTIEESQVFEKQLIQVVHRLSEQNPIILIEDNCHLFPFFTHDVLIKQHDIGQPENQPSVRDWVSDSFYSLLFSHKSNEEDYCYVVIDAAIYQQSGRFIVPDLIASGLTWRCLYKGESSQTLEYIAPYLVNITLNGMKETDFHRRLFTLYRHQPIDLIIHSKSNFDEIYHHLRKFTYVQKEVEGEWVYFRFYQVFSLLPLFQAMEASELASFMRHINHCWLQDAENKMLIHQVSVTERIKSVSPSIFQLTLPMLAVFEQQQYQKLVSKIEKFITDNLLEYMVVSIDELSDFIRFHINQAYLMGLSIERAVLYYVAARSLSKLYESQWMVDVITEKQTESTSQELFAQRLLSRTLINNQNSKIGNALWG